MQASCLRFLNAFSIPVQLFGCLC